ncbi:hypothetical protein N7462_002991 [Penicillium macrosclerotiorum]|uniref:uncharacterized protein n=1 Tax=Penicillium macrosclerotiorum TaxID=303699 RepID=UPI0025470F3D|nr:uncharacterized protein N7462_002991 [Penicillium macrosclerotiorum]KAJ5688599.1 hypothetical protein N7462_002991 [Penicillium macrosclerotiorum]
MEIIDQIESFKTIQGVFQFSHVEFFILEDGILYHGTWKDRKTRPRERRQLADIQIIIRENRGPWILDSWSVVSGNDSYIKTPKLFAYLAGAALEKQILREVETCELLRRHPHRNIAIYHGCQNTRNRVSGLCFKRYSVTLFEAANPRHYGKNHFRESGREFVTEPIKAALNGILDGIRHLHSLGLVHNDINPANIMLDENNVPVLIDFDSCRRIGESLRDTRAKRTHEWHDPEVEVAAEKNDLDAFTDLKTWLIGQESQTYLFSSGGE